MIKLIRRYVSLWWGPTARDMMLAFGSRVVDAFAGLFNLIVLSRFLGPESFGRITVATSFMSLNTELSDMGTSVSVQRYGRQYINEGRTVQAQQVFDAALIIRTLAAIVVVALVLAAGNFWSGAIFHGNIETKLLQVSVIGVLGLSVVSFISNYYIACGKYTRNLLFIGIRAALIVVAIAATIFGLGQRSPTVLLLVFSLVPLLYGALWLWGLYRRELSFGGINFESWKRLLNFGKWVWLSSLSVMVISRIDIFMMARYTTPAETGIFSSAYRLSFFFSAVTSSVIAVLLPKVATYRTPKEFRDDIRRTTRMTIPLAAALLITIFFAGPVFLLLFGRGYQQGFPVFQVMVIGFIIGIVHHPIAVVLYAMDKAYIITALNFVQLLINYFGDLWAVPRWGGLGAAWVSCAMRLFGFIVIALYLYYLLYHREKGSQNSE